MPPIPMDALTSFLLLTENLPQWIQKVNDLANHASKRHAEFAAEYSRLLVQANAGPRKERSASVDSVHSNKDQQPIPRIPVEPNHNGTPLPSDAVEISALDPANKYLLAETRRKRKPTSSIRSNASGPRRYRSRQKVIIYYDSYLQGQLEGLVKNIAGVRNNLRKGKTSRALHRGLQLPTFTRSHDIGYFTKSNLPIEVQKSPQSVNTTNSSLDPTAPQTETEQSLPDSAFTEADKTLEQAQALCENAAHQVLRDGDCTSEMAEVRSYLESVLELAYASVEQLKAERPSPVPALEEDHLHTDSESTLVSDCSPSLSSSRLGVNNTVNAKSIGPPLLEVGEAGGGCATNNNPVIVPLATDATEIEVDDASDTDSIVIDISKFRVARAAGIRMR